MMSRRTKLDKMSDLLRGKTIQTVKFTKGDGVAVDLGFTDGTAFSFLIDIRPAASAVFFKTGQDAEGFEVSFQEE
jgi:hypothetical protein